MKKVKLNLEGVDGNAFAILGTFQKHARRQGWTKQEIDQVTNKATEGDYNHLIATIVEHIED